MTWTFNKDYSDYAQVEEFFPAYMERFQALKAAGKYPYNDSFKGHVPGIEGPCEDSAIYMLQGLRSKREDEARLAGLLEAGYVHLDTVAAVTRFKSIVLYPHGRMDGAWAQYEDARLIPYESGEPRAILPKGKRTNGHLVSGRAVLVKK